MKATIDINRHATRANFYTVTASDKCITFDCESFRVESSVNLIKRKLIGSGFKPIQVINHSGITVLNRLES